MKNPFAYSPEIAKLTSFSEEEIQEAKQKIKKISPKDYKELFEDESMFPITEAE